MFALLLKIGDEPPKRLELAVEMFLLRRHLQVLLVWSHASLPPGSASCGVGRNHPAALPTLARREPPPSLSGHPGRVRTDSAGLRPSARQGNLSMPWRTASARSQCSGSLAVPPKEVLTSTRACQAANGLLTGGPAAWAAPFQATAGDGLRRRWLTTATEPHARGRGGPRYAPTAGHACLSDRTQVAGAASPWLTANLHDTRVPRDDHGRLYTS
jgi:hypothetical protein